MKGANFLWINANIHSKHTLVQCVGSEAKRFMSCDYFRSLVPLLFVVDDDDDNDNNNEDDVPFS